MIITAQKPRRMGIGKRITKCAIPFALLRNIGGNRIGRIKPVASGDEVTDACFVGHRAIGDIRHRLIGPVHVAQLPQ